MKPFRCRVLSAVALLALAAPSAAVAQSRPEQATATIPWLFAGSDIPADPAWRFGTLANGVRYAVRQNKLPVGTWAIRVRIGAGALMERDDEKGYAHFVEHMAFRGTKTVPDGEGIRVWQRLGAQFGSDTNAFTSLSQTLYQLDLPKSDMASADTALNLLAEMVSSASFDPKLVDIERNVVTAERALRQPPLAKRIQDVSKAILLTGTRAQAADIAGTDATLKAASAERLRAFYHRWYRPERATVVIVGDADPAVLEAAVRRHFSSWSGRGPGPVDPAYGKPEAPKATAAVIADPQAPSQLSLSWVTQHDERPDTVAAEAADLTRLVATQVLARRLDRRAREGASFLSGGASFSEQRHVADRLAVVVAPKNGQWQQALNETFAILADAIATLPSQYEVDQITASIEAALQAAAAGAATQQSAALANQLMRAVDEGEVVVEPAAMLRLYEAQRKNLTPENVGAALRSLIQGNARAIFLSPVPVAGGDAALEAALTAARAVKAAARTEEKKVSLDDLGRPGTPGKIVWTTTIPTLDVTRVKFENGVELVLKRTDFDQAGVLVVAQAGDGLAGVDPKAPPLLWTAPAIVQGGVGPLDIGALERAAAGKRIGLSFGVGERAFTWSGATTAAQLVDQLRLLDAAIREPRFDSNAFMRVRDGFFQNYDTIFNSPGAVFSAFANAALHGGDQRYGLPRRSALAGVTPDTYRAFWQPLFAGGPRKLLIIGDIDPKAAIEAARQTFGAAVTKPPAKLPAAYLAVRPPTPQAGPLTLDHKGDPDQMLVAETWATTGGLADLGQMRALNVAAQIIQTRLYDRFRESEGGTYTPSVRSSQSETFPDYGVFIASSQIKTERQADFERATQEITHALAKDGPSADELARAIAPIVSGNDRQRRLNPYWVQMLQGDLDDPRYVELIRTGVTGYQQVTAEAVRKAAQRWLDHKPALRVLVKGAAPAAKTAG